MKGMRPEQIIRYYDEVHIERTFDELYERFGFPKKEWKKKFKEYLFKQPRNTSETDAFIKFGNTFINPVLNDILCRHSLTATFNKLLNYVIQKTSIPGK